MKYYMTNNIHIVEVSAADFKIILNDSKKKSVLSRNYCNAGFFANFDENKQQFTLPVAHLMCDYDAKSQYTKRYCAERGKFNDNKFIFDASTWSYNNPFYQKAISTLLVKDDKAEIKEIVSIPAGYDYAVSGIPVMKNGLNVNFDIYVKGQGWDDSPLYGTWHIFVGLKKNFDTIYVMGMKTTTWNMVKTGEAYKKFKALDMFDVIKLDGGGSFYMNVDGKPVASTSENRRINTIICFDNIIDSSLNDESVEDNLGDDTNKVVERINENATKTNKPSITSVFKTNRHNKKILKLLCK